MQKIKEFQNRMKSSFIGSNQLDYENLIRIPKVGFETITKTFNYFIRL